MSELARKIVSKKISREILLQRIPYSILIILWLLIPNINIFGISKSTVGIMGYDQLIHWQYATWGPDFHQHSFHWITSVPFWLMHILLCGSALTLASIQRKQKSTHIIQSFHLAIPWGFILTAIILLSISIIDGDYWEILIQNNSSELLSLGRGVNKTSPLGPILLLFICQIFATGMNHLIHKLKNQDWADLFIQSFLHPILLVVGYILVVSIRIQLHGSIKIYDSCQIIGSMNFCIGMAIIWFLWHHLFMIWLLPPQASIKRLTVIATRQGKNPNILVPLWQCPKCKYDLTGSLLADQKSCPECGHQLTKQYNAAKRAAQKHARQVSSKP